MIQIENGKLQLEKHECHELTKMVTEGLRPNIDNQVHFRVREVVQGEMGRIKMELIKHTCILSAVLAIGNLFLWWIFK